MANIFTLENFSDFSEKINIDELYEKKRQIDLSKLELFKKILNRIHVRIKTTSKQSINEKCCWFVVPEIIIGVPKYDQSGCIAYLMNALQENGFNVRYFHPNTLFICWEHWVPSYVRNEIKKKTGIVINEYGERIGEDNTDGDDGQEINHQTDDIHQIKNSKKYTPINSYKPSGKLVYSEDLLNKIENKIN
jgi:RNase P subunit RPR2